MNTYSFGALTTNVIMFLLSCSNVTNAQVDTGNGYIYKLEATQDVFIEDSSNYNFYDFLIVAKHPGYPKKRMLLQFQDLPSTCKQINWAKMHIFYWYSHKASFMTVQQVPSIARTLQVRQIKKQWNETQATSINHQSGIQWTSPFLALDGSDAATYVQDNVILRPNQKTRVYIEFDITEAALNWKSGEPNYGALVWATNENEKGRDICFFSRERTTGKPYVNVLCAYNEDNSSKAVVHLLLARPTATSLPCISSN